MSWRRELRQAVEIDVLRARLRKKEREAEALPRVREENARQRERIRALEFDNETLFRFVPPEDRRCAYGFLTTFREIADSEEIERKP